MIETFFPKHKWCVHNFARSYVVPSVVLSTYMDHMHVADHATQLFFRTNSLYDPDGLTGNSHEDEPSMYPFMAIYYASYEVYSSKITIIFTQKDAEGEFTRLGLGLRMDDNAVLQYNNSSFESARQDGAWHCKSMTCVGSGAKTPSVRLTHKWSRKSLDTGQKTSNCAGVGTNPSYSDYFLPTWCDLNPIGGTEGPALIVTVRISYLARWTDRRDLSNMLDLLPPSYIPGT